MQITESTIPVGDAGLRAAVGVQPPFELIALGDTIIACARRGVGQAVLCLSATGHGGRDFEGFCAAVVPHGFEVVAVDWPGHGASPPAPAGSTVSASAYAALVAQLIPKLWPDCRQPIVLGNSIGGAAAIRLASQHPSLVRALVLSNPGGLAPLNPVSRFVIGRMAAFFRAGARRASWFPRAFALYYKMVLPARPARAQRQRIVAASRELAPLLAQAWESFRAPDADLRAAVAALPHPVLYAWAKDDRIVSWSASKAAALATPHHAVELFRGGHSPFLEAPDEFATAFLAFAASQNG